MRLVYYETAVARAVVRGAVLVDPGVATDAFDRARFTPNSQLSIVAQRVAFHISYSHDCCGVFRQLNGTVGGRACCRNTAFQRHRAVANCTSRLVHAHCAAGAAVILAAHHTYAAAVVDVQSST